MQGGFRILYAELCVRLDAHLASQDNIIGGKAFRKALANQCQLTFERSLQPPDPSVFADLDSERCFEVEMQLKTRRLGNMRFIGDLLVRRLLAPRILPPLIHGLLGSDEAKLESLIALVGVVAAEFEVPSHVWSALRQKVSEKAVSPRMRCQINDLLDAKARGWAPRSVD